MIKIKTGVKPKILVIAAACANVAEEMKVTITITSGNDSKHMKGSKHYTYEALDIRSKNFASSSEKLIFLSKVMTRLGDDYDGLLEYENLVNEHFHIEYDPKKPQ